MRITRTYRNLFVWGIFMLAAILVCSMAVHAGDNGYRYHVDHSVKHEDTVEDLQWLAGMMKELTNTEIALTAVTYGVAADTIPHMNLSEIAQLLLNHAPDALYQQSDDGVSGSVQLGDTASLSVGVQKHRDQLILMTRIQSARMEGLAAYQEWFQDIEASWASLGLRTDWRLNLQAILRDDLQPEDVWTALGRSGASTASPDEVYSDSRSISRTYHVPGLHGEVVAAGQEVNLQAALHRSTLDEAYRITLGTPLITIEY